MCPPDWPVVKHQGVFLIGDWWGRSPGCDEEARRASHEQAKQWAAPLHGLSISSAPRSYSEFLPWRPWMMEYKLWTEIILSSSSWFWSCHFTAVMETLTKRTIMKKRHGPENICPLSLSFFFNLLHPKSPMITYLYVSINLSFIQYQYHIVGHMLSQQQWLSYLFISPRNMPVSFF